ncbi:MAG: VWA-like domain-containing protein [Victivallaceae bacterium]|nr:VWA-like domain-containing protein [Victivallaceae bacterium]
MIEITPQQINAESERLAALRMQMLEMHPFWGYLLLQMRLVPALGLPTFAATDAINHIWFNPALTRDLDVRELGFVLAHEVCHQVLATMERRNGREEFKWNMATDYAINAMVADIKIPGAAQWGDNRLYQMPEAGLFNPKYHDWVAEVIYEDLCRKELKTSPVSIEVILPGDNGSEMQLPVVSDHRGGIDIHLPQELDADQQELLRERILAAVENFHANSDRGDLPDDLLHASGLLEEPKIPWQRVLHHYVDAILNGDDYSLARPNKHYWVQDLLIPGHYGESVSNLVVALDTSGSMTEENIREVATEIRGMVPNAQDVTLIVADSAVHQVIPLDGLEEILKSGAFRGGGGTDHVCVFEYIREHHLYPRVFIGLSDLCSRFPEKKPPYPILWLVPEDHEEPPWGKVIEL